MGCYLSINRTCGPVSLAESPLAAVMCLQPRDSRRPTTVPANIAILCQGSVGDCQPFIALALALQKAGTRVRLYAPAEMEAIYAPLFQNTNADFYPLPHCQIQRALDSKAAWQSAMNTGKFTHFVKAVEDLEMLDRGIADANAFLHDLRTAFPADHIVYNPCVLLYGATAAELFGVSSTLVSMQMIIAPSASEPTFLMPPATTKRLPGCINRLIWYCFARLMVNSRTFLYIDKHWRREQLALRALTIKQKIAILRGQSHGCSPVVARSPLLSPPPADWSATDRERVLGALVIDAEDQVKAWPPSPALCHFLEKQADRPIYIGWGSMTAVSPQHMITLAVRALVAIGQRAVILAGWARLRIELLEESDAPDARELLTYAKVNVFILDVHVPHEWLFPRCAAIVHHGGAGTTASAVRSSKPSVVTPCFVDQPELADKVEKLGVGIALGQFASVTAASLADALRKALFDDALRARAATIGERLRAEDGAVVVAADIMSRIQQYARQDNSGAGAGAPPAAGHPSASHRVHLIGKA